MPDSRKEEREAQLREPYSFLESSAQSSTALTAFRGHWPRIASKHPEKCNPFSLHIATYNKLKGGL
jgi:hypothetical protein